MLQGILNLIDFSAKRNTAFSKSRASSKEGCGAIAGSKNEFHRMPKGMTKASARCY